MAVADVKTIRPAPPAPKVKLAAPPSVLAAEQRRELRAREAVVARWLRRLSAARP